MFVHVKVVEESSALGGCYLLRLRMWKMKVFHIRIDIDVAATSAMADSLHLVHCLQVLR